MQTTTLLAPSVLRAKFNQSKRTKFGERSKGDRVRARASAFGVGKMREFLRIDHSIRSWWGRGRWLWQSLPMLKVDFGRRFSSEHKVLLAYVFAMVIIMLST